MRNRRVAMGNAKIRLSVAPLFMLTLGFATMTIMGFQVGCTAGPAQPSLANREIPLDSLPTGAIEVGGESIRVWLALNDETRTEGLMHVGESDIADDQGMLFVFETERDLSFWMRNTYIPLDIAYARSDGTIVATHQMEPLTLQGYPSYEPARFALEMKAGSFDRLGVSVGDQLVIPDDLIK